MKSAHHHKVDKEVALNQLLTSYRSTPHPATGESPGAIMLRSGYQTEFPHQELSTESVQAAFAQDQDQKLQRSRIINASKHRAPSTLRVGDQVYMRNQRSSKFQPIFGPETYTVIDINNGGATIQSNQGNKSYRRHFDDLKIAPQPPNNEITWFPPCDVQPPMPGEPANAAADIILPRRNPPRNVRPPPYLDDYVRFIAEV